MANPNLLANVSSIAQDGVVVLGALAAGSAVVVTALAAFGVHVDQATLVQQIGGLGALLTVARTTLDSLTKTAVTVETPKAAPQSSTPLTGA